jgi:predicted acetyltransferase
MTDLTTIRSGTADDWPAIDRLMDTVFHETPQPEPDPTWQAVFEPDRSLLIEDGDELVAHAVAFTRELSVPGCVLPAAHVSMVGVAPTYRRQGLLTRLMTRLLAGVPEPLAVLWASEGRIYPRFGYGMATLRVSLSVNTREVRLPEPAGTGRLRVVPVDKARPELERVYESVWRDRPGWSSRDGRWWSRTLSDPPGHRHGATPRQIALHEGATGVDGYALWRTKSDWSAAGPQGEVRVQEVVTADPEVHLALWRFLLSIDLIRTAKLPMGGQDEPLLHLADEPRELGARLSDGLFVRVVDLPAALTGRRYAAPADLVLDVTDPLRGANSGRWHLTADPDRVTCVRTERPPDLACHIADLGAAYLGATTLGALAAAGRVRELRPGALARASTAFGWHRTAAGLEVF